MSMCELHKFMAMMAISNTWADCELSMLGMTVTGMLLILNRHEMLLILKKLFST